MFQQKAAASAELRKSLVPLRIFSLPETGGQLNIATHVYYYNDLAERTAKRKVSAMNEEWVAFVNDSRQHVAKQHSNLYQENVDIMRKVGCEGLVVPESPDSGAVYEIKRYRKDKDTTEEDIISTIKTVTEATLVSIMTSKIGLRNEQIEIWRHPLGMNFVDSKEEEVRTDLRTSFHQPLAFSPWK